MWVGLFFILAYCAIFEVVVVRAESLQSQSYRLDESTVGSGGLDQSDSASYQVSNASGDLTIGNAASAGYQIEAGSKTSPDPALAFSVNSFSANFGSFSSTEPSVSTATFSVSNYTSYGYAVQVIGNPPSNGEHVIDAMETTGDSQTGTEQFGINLVANTLPVSFGANPDNGQFGFGSVASNYSTSNKYRYVSGETIALASKSSGVTNYTISYLINVETLTPGGQYASDQTLVVTGTY